MGRITKESWEIIANEIIFIVSTNDNEEDACQELEDYLTGEGIIEVVED